MTTSGLNEEYLETSQVRRINIMPERKVLVRRRDFFIFLSCIIVSCITVTNNSHEYNKLLALLPVTFGLCYVLILAPLRLQTESKTVMWFEIVEAIRLVFVPIYEAHCEYVGFYHFSTQDMSLLARSVLLIAYECLFLSIFLFFYYKTRKINNEGENSLIPLGNDKIALFIVFLVGLFLYFAIPDIRRSINFFLLKSNSEKVRALTTNSKSSLVVGLITFTYDAFLCGIIISFDYFKNRYDNSGKKIYVSLGIIMGLIAVCIINGESRSNIVYTLYAVVCCLCICFQKYKNNIKRILLTAACVVLLGMTIYRVFAVYNHSSYFEVLKGASIREHYFESFVEMYFLGPQSVACGLLCTDTLRGQYTIGTFIYDIARPFMGLNFIAKLFNENTSTVLYNSWFFGKEGLSNGLLLQISNQGYNYFGFFLAPIFGCVFMRIALFIEEKLKQPNTIYLVFFYNYIYIRMATCVMAGTMSGYISAVTMALLVCGVIYLLQKLISNTIRKSK